MNQLADEIKTKLIAECDQRIQGSLADMNEREKGLKMCIEKMAIIKLCLEGDKVDDAFRKKAEKDYAWMKNYRDKTVRKVKFHEIVHKHVKLERLIYNGFGYIWLYVLNP